MEARRFGVLMWHRAAPVTLSGDPPRWRCGGGCRSSEASFNKRCCGSCYLDLEELLYPSCRGGGGGGRGSLFDRWRCDSTCFGAIPRAQHMETVVAMIFGRYGGPSSTSMAEACLIHRESSTHLGYQVVCPRYPRGGWWSDLFVGGELSNPLSDLGGDA
jgi:hypothetical protein